MLFFSLIALMTGLFGHRWRRLFVIPGLVFGVAGFMLFIVGMQMLTAGGSHNLLPSTAYLPIVLFTLVDSVLLAAFLPDARPSKRRARRAAARRRQARITRKLPRPLPAAEMPAETLATEEHLEG